MYIKYNSDSMEPYLNSALLNNKEKDTLFKLRSKMYPGIKANFKNHFKETTCPLGCNLQHIDSQINLLVCPKLINNVDTKGIKYSFIFGSVPNQVKATKIFMKLLEKREDILTNKVKPVLISQCI